MIEFILAKNFDFMLIWLQGGITLVKSISKLYMGKRRKEVFMEIKFQIWRFAFQFTLFKIKITVVRKRKRR